jgi:hypothetical protein
VVWTSVMPVVLRMMIREGIKALIMMIIVTIMII